MPVQVPQESEAYVREQPMNPYAAVASEPEASPAAPAVPATTPVFQQETPAQNTHMPQFAPQTEPTQTPKKKSGKKLPIPLIIGVVAVVILLLMKLYWETDEGAPMVAYKSFYRVSEYDYE